jgi:ribosome assembly protein 4
MLSGHKGWVLCVEWEALERKLATGGHDGHVRSWRLRYCLIVTLSFEGTNMGSKIRNTSWRCAKRTLEMDHVSVLGTDSHVGDRLVVVPHTLTCTWIRNPSAPRLASSSKDGTVKVWVIATRRLEYTLGGHSASVNVVRWGGGGLNGKGVLYTASSDCTVRIWDANGVRFFFAFFTTKLKCPYYFRAGLSIR